ncbi:DNA-directed RNA polymerase I subunit RPA34.5-domain-containing protein [Annulohypoxylon maeteangense]|uniref:DNA-directed RNA polymerase I subunit RPA34.5-domain-containing protein n=1 Tax=Annulohypoxylon maeteangense TaxID=1927788 RepID=UPI002007888E|nr:DNA-directed RNA polymerase I subunit RPA34.5-domain-containing protein [Annulohypoxylon maeteangense]KAI0886815.1 DNA-directed RNA polymerase I subunit RPA34.5-domain-containing protein [Annulohypoxylon maeteangense]
MAKHRARAPIASLDSLVSRVRDQKAATNSTPGSSKLQNTKKFAETSDSGDSDDTSSDDSDGSNSDSEVDVDAARKKYTEKQKSKRKSTQQSIPTKSQPTKSTSTSNELPTTKPTKSTTFNSKDSESDSDSDSDSSSQSSDSSDIPTQNTVTKQESPEKNGDKDSSDSDSDTSSENESENESEDGNRDKATSAQRPAEVESSSDEDSDSSSSDADEESTHDAMDVDDNNEVIVNGNTPAPGSASQVSRPAWIDNSNFVLRKASSDNPAKEVADFFNNTNLEGKQVWYFTAPASLPITVLKDMEIDLSKATTGEALLNHKGDDYGLDLESHATSTQIQLLIPSQGGDKYAALNRGIDSTVHLRRIAKFGPGGAVSATATDDYAPIPKAIREQPQGLKPRFTPIGVPTPTWQGISSASVSQSNGSKKSKKSDGVSGQLKRKHPGQGADQATAEQGSQSKGKSAKRPKTSKSKETPIQPPAITLSASAPGAIDTPSKVRTPTNKAKNDKAAFKPKKETPVPVPTVLSMNMRR